MQELDLVCASGWQIGFFGSAFFIGNVLGSCTLANLGDTVGRIRILRIVLTLNSLLLGLLLYASKNIYFHYILMFGYGVISNLRVNLGFLYGQEICVRSQKNMLGSLYNACDAASMFWIAIYFKFISKYWLFLYSLIFLLNVAAMIIAFLVPESPKYLVAAKKFKAARASFNKIAKINKREPLDPQVDAIKKEVEH